MLIFDVFYLSQSHLHFIAIKSRTRNSDWSDFRVLFVVALKQRTYESSRWFLAALLCHRTLSFHHFQVIGLSDYRYHIHFLICPLPGG